MIAYWLVGMLFGGVLTEAEVLSWFRIQEMFRFDAFHMYGILGSAVLTAALSLRLIRHLGLRSAGGEPVTLPAKTFGSGARYAIGGTVFGLGWALSGACPGPMVALVGAGVPVMLVTLASAVFGTWVYGLLRPHLPH